MTEFEPTTDFPEYIDDDDTPVESEARSHDRTVLRRRHRLIQLGILVLGLVLVGFGLPVLRVLVALALMYLILMGGIAVIGAFARPVPEAPPPGELRRVRLSYRCPTCGAELRMTLANDQIPQAPRHCADEMDLVTPVDEV